MFKKVLLGFGLVTALFAGASAYAVTPSNTLLTNTATLDFDGNGTPISATVSVAVQLVEAPVSIIATQVEPADVSLAQGSSYDETYYIQTNANGPDTYTISFDALSVVGVTGYTDPPIANPFGTVASAIELGASAAAAAATSGQPNITVPSDTSGAGGNTPINGLEEDDFVFIKGKEYQIASTVDNPNGTSTITLTTNLQDALVVGDAISEFVTFDVEFATVGSPDAGTGTVEYTVNVTTDSGANPVYSNTVVITVVEVDFQKYVRNITNPNGSGTSIDYNSDGVAGDETFYLANVTAVPTDTLEYLLVVTAPGAGAITSPVVVDVLPAFTTYANGTTQLEITNTAALATVTDDANPNEFPLSSVNAGLGFATVPAGETAYIVYQVTLSN